MSIATRYRNRSIFHVSVMPQFNVIFAEAKDTFLIDYLSLIADRRSNMHYLIPVFATLDPKTDDGKYLTF